MMKKGNPILWMFLMPAIAVFSCQREKLDGERAYLIGRWQWQKTYVFNSTQSSLIDSVVNNDHYLIEFKEKGWLVFEREGNKKKESIHFDYGTCSGNAQGTVNYCEYSINNSKYHLSFSVTDNREYVIFRNGFPYTGNDELVYRNLFVRQ